MYIARWQMLSLDNNTNTAATNAAMKEEGEKGLEGAQ